MEIRGKTISYSSYEKKKEKEKEESLLNEIATLEKSTDQNFDLLETKKKNLKMLEGKKLKVLLSDQELDGQKREKNLLNTFVV